MAGHRQPLPIDQVADWQCVLAAGAESMGVPLDRQALDRFSAFGRMLQAWGSRLNLSSRLDAGELIPLHFLDSIAPLTGTGIPNGSTLLDLGSGAGIPGIPLAVARPDLRITLLEPRLRRAVFLREAVHRLSLDRVSVSQERAENLAAVAEQAGSFDWATARAVASPGEVLDLAGPLLTVGGHLVFFLGPDETPASTPRFALDGVPAVPIPGKPAPRRLAIFRKLDHPHNRLCSTWNIPPQGG